MVSQNFTKANGDHCIYIKNLCKGNFIIVLLYVNDTLIVRQDVDMNLSKSFDMKDLGHAKHIFMCEKYLQ